MNTGESLCEDCGHELCCCPDEPAVKPMTSPAVQLELQVMAHRYRYYVLSDPAIPDSVYDAIEREARAACPEQSPVHGVGSSLPSSYTAEQIAYAERLK